MPVFPSTPPDYASDSVTKFIPEIWSGKLQVKFYRSTVLSEITNNDWAGEIKGHGDKVIIRRAPDIAVLDYVKNAALSNQIPASDTSELLIDKGKYFSVILDDVNAVQSDLQLMDMFTNDAAEQMKQKIDYEVLNLAPTSSYAYVDEDNPPTRTDIPWASVVDLKNQGATAGKISSSVNLGTGAAPLTPVQTAVAGNFSQVACNPLDVILRAGLVLDEQNIPDNGRWIVLPSWMGFMLKTSDLKAVYLTGDPTSPLRNGKIGMVDRFTVYLSNNYKPNGAGPTAALFGARDGISFASQITNVETLRSTTTFGNIVRGLNVFGYGLTAPTALGIVQIKPPAPPGLMMAEGESAAERRRRERDEHYETLRRRDQAKQASRDAMAKATREYQQRYDEIQDDSDSGRVRTRAFMGEAIPESEERTENAMPMKEEDAKRYDENRDTFGGEGVPSASGGGSDLADPRGDGRHTRPGTKTKVEERNEDREARVERQRTENPEQTGGVKDVASEHRAARTQGFQSQADDDAEKPKKK